MKKKDVLFFLIILCVFAPFFIFNDLLSAYKQFNKEHGLIMSFIKFAILATMGEVIGLRIKTGNYNQPGFGIVPRAIIWGVLGLTIFFAFKVFSTGTPAFLEYVGVSEAAKSLSGEFSFTRILVAFSISTGMNLIFAPVMMTLHKITDIHIERNKGSVVALFKPIEFEQIMPALNWKVQWNFVFKKTIPFFWIPAHTITFLLPSEYQVLFAALLGIALGVLLSLASLKSKK